MTYAALLSHTLYRSFYYTKNRTSTALSNFREFLKKWKFAETLSMIFRIRSPKGTFVQNMSYLPNRSLTGVSRSQQSAILGTSQTSEHLVINLFNYNWTSPRKWNETLGLFWKFFFKRNLFQKLLFIFPCKACQYINFFLWISVVFWARRWSQNKLHATDSTNTEIKEIKTDGTSYRKTLVTKATGILA